jgi:hypothetical protein
MVTRQDRTTAAGRTRSQRAPAPARPALPAKLTRPTASGLIQRERLFTRLDRSLQSKIVWISGPATRDLAWQSLRARVAHFVRSSVPGRLGRRAFGGLAAKSV